MDAATKTGLNALKTATKKVAHKAAEATREFIGNKITDQTLKPKPMLHENSRNVEEIIIEPEKKEDMLKTSMKILNTTKYPDY